MDNQSYTRIKRIAPYYNFINRIAFPSTTKIILAIFGVNLAGCAVAFSVNQFTGQSIIFGLTFGLLGFAVPSIVSDCIIHLSILKKDSLFYLRRCFALSLFSCLTWVFFLLLGAFLSTVSPKFIFPDHAFYLGLFAVAPLRFISILSMSSVSFSGRLLSSIFQPSLCLFSAASFLHLPMSQSLFMLIISVIIAFTGVSLLLTYIEFQGRKKIGASPLHVFRAFLIDWLDWKNELFEEYLEGLGCYQPISITLIGFKKKGGGQLKGVVAVSNFHPGPFLNIGSSVLPSLIQTFIEKKTGAVVAVPHGVSGHESNLVSQRQNERVLRKIEDLLNFSQFSSFASPFIRFEIGYGKASCQIFGENALATLTLSPRSMEDIPAEVAEALSSWSENCPEDAALIDAHNCIDDLALTTDEELDDLKKSLKMAVETAAKEPRLPFKVGVAKLSLKDFTLDQGIGPGGLVVLLVETRSQLAGYITIDGNNMAMGLREKILRKLREMGVSDGEVMTTDTHMVNGIVSAKHGYHPVGESIDQKKLIEYVEVAVNEAKNNLEEAEVAWKSAEVEVKVLGSKALRRLINFLYSNIKLVAISMIPVVAVPIIVCLAILL